MNLFKPLTRRDHALWTALIEAVRDDDASVDAVHGAVAACDGSAARHGHKPPHRRAKRRQRAVSQRTWVMTPDGYRHADSCFFRLLRDGAAFTGAPTERLVLRRFAECCRDVLASLPLPEIPKSDARRKSGAGRGAPLASRWLNRADING